MVEKWVIVKIGLAVLLLGIAGGGLSLATRIYDPLWNPFRPEPAQILTELTQAQEKIKTSHYQGTVKAEAKEDTTELFYITLDFEGDSNNSEPESPKSAGNFRMKIGSEGMEFSFSAEVKTIGNTSYLKLTEIPFLPMLGMMGIPYEDIKGQWIKMESEEIGAETQEELIEKMQEILEGREFFLVKEELADEKIEGRKVYHYLVILDKEELKEIIPELFEELMKASGEEEMISLWTEEDKEEMIKSLDEFLEKVGEVGAQLWIDKKTLFVRRVKLEKEINMQAFAEGEKGELIFSMEMNISKFNLPIKIEAPEGAKTWEEIFPQIPSPYLPETEPEYYYEFEEWPKEYPGLLSLPLEELWTLGGLASMINAFEAVLRGF